MAKTAFIEYAFIFEPASTWQHLSQFENDLAEFFRQNDLEAQIVKSVSGQVGKRVMFIKSLSKFDTMSGKNHPSVGVKGVPLGKVKDVKVNRMPKSRGGVFNRDVASGGVNVRKKASFKKGRMLSKRVPKIKL